MRHNLLRRRGNKPSGEARLLSASETGGSMFHGMLNIYKEAGYTSSDVVARLRGILRMKKIGHTGTLDPDAEGVLPVCLGNGTKLCALIADHDKEYVAVLRLGVTTDTQDMSGEILRSVSEEEVCESVTEKEIFAAAARFLGEVEQVPPMYSAVKVGGKRLYQLAREGKTVEREPRKVQIYELEITQIDLPRVTIRVRCSKGTYIRTLCQDLGDALEVGGAMEHLLRTRVGRFRLEDAITLDEAERIMKTEGPEKMKEKILPVDRFFADAPRAEVREESLKLLQNGNTLKRSMTDMRERPAEGYVRMYDANGKFYALYQYVPKKDELRIVRMFPS